MCDIVWQLSYRSLISQFVTLCVHVCVELHVFTQDSLQTPQLHCFQFVLLISSEFRNLCFHQFVCGSWERFLLKETGSDG